MCRFKSVIVVREPRNKGGFDLIHSDATDSHSELIAAHNLRDDGELRFCRVEFSPSSVDWTDLEKYRLTIDEERTPEWFDSEMKEAVADKLRGIVKRMIVPKTGITLFGGAWIVPRGFEVTVGPMTRIVVNYGTVGDSHGLVSLNRGLVSLNYGTVGDNRGLVGLNHGTVGDNDGTVSVNHCTVSVNYGTVIDNDGLVGDNHGTVIDNDGLMSLNHGTVIDNRAYLIQNDTIYGKGVIVLGEKALKQSTH